ncbi:MAG: polysaccharide deacetylase family protein, partial [Pseudomonadota bacterium]
EYGSRAGVWLLLDEFEKRGWPLTVFAVAMALNRHPQLANEFKRLGHEVACHGLRWIHYQDMDEDTEREHMREALEILTRLCGSTPLGWYTGRDSPNTRRLVVDQENLIYDSDYYGDDLPLWKPVENSAGNIKNHLIIPYTLDVNDMRFATAQGFNSGEQFYQYLKDSFDVLYQEGAKKPKMMSVGLHCRLVGRPGRFRALQRFMDYVESHDQVWICRRIDIANHWMDRHPPQTA